MKRLISLLLLLLAGNALAHKQGAYDHEVFFEGSDYELNVYRIKGREPGKTLLLIGGIQGDEPGGYLSADLYPDIVLAKGNLIIVPRANLKSIILNSRGSDGDMNRQFHDGAKPGPMTGVVEKLKGLMGEADMFLHLHDGWGFHYPVYVDKSRNPDRFGQSLITDADSFTCKNGTKLDLRRMAEEVLAQVNGKIDEKNYHLHYFNTHTGAEHTRHEAMRKTATYYALREHCIPAFGVEASKNLPTVELKILSHNLVINQFMNQLGIVPETPKVFVPPPKLQFVELEINGKSRLLKSGESVELHKGDLIRVSQVGSNYPRGVSYDLLGYGDLNDKGQQFRINKDTRLVFRKEGREFGSIALHVVQAGSKKPPAGDSKPAVTTADVAPRHRVFLLTVNGVERVYLPGSTVRIGYEDNLKLISCFGDGNNSDLPSINFKGWVPDEQGNSGDDRGYQIVPKDEHFMQKYSRHGRGKVYPVVAEDSRGKELGKLWIAIGEERSNGGDNAR